MSEIKKGGGLRRRGRRVKSTGLGIRPSPSPSLTELSSFLAKLVQRFRALAREKGSSRTEGRKEGRKGEGAEKGKEEERGGRCGGVVEEVGARTGEGYVRKREN